MALLAIDQDRPQAQCARALDVLLERIADHHRVGGTNAEEFQRSLEDRGVRLDPPMRAGVHDRIDVEAVVGDELGQVTDPVRDEPDAQPRLAQLFQSSERILVELEVLRDFPALLDLRRALGREIARTSHTSKDLLGEAVPDRIVVEKLRMTLEVENGRFARLFVERGIEDDTVPGRNARVALGRELGPGTAEREIDVEENGTNGSHAASSTSQR